MRYRCWPVIVALALPTAAAAQEVDVTAGGSFSNGRYGSPDRTELGVAYVSVGATYPKWRFDVTLPYLTLNSGGEAVEIGGITLPGGFSTSGVGDLTVRASRTIALPSTFELAVGAQVKVPTGKRSLSTGKFDGRLDLELSRDIGTFSPFAAVGYNTYGDSALLRLQDGGSLSAGSTATLGTTTFIGSYDWSESSVGGPSAHELSAVAVGPLTRGWNWTVYGSKGLSSGAADFLVGVGVTRTFGRTGMPATRRPH